ncbi:MAG: adenosine deaminase [Candidatus Acetothermia bacterium]|nr:adenosine deaminase [Candidatus Acetothermia bacterium]MDH7505076.1 adenosine deaminase [Candidatus Acetothermia bacterium]
MPKFDLHVHLDGSLRPGTILELTKRGPRGPHLPNLEAIERAVTPPRHCQLEEYLQPFQVTLALLQTDEALERAAYELCEDAAREQVVYIEIRFAPLLHLKAGLSPQKAVESVLAGMRRAEQAYPVKTGLIICGMKQHPPEKVERTARLAADYLGQGVVGFDLAGPEEPFPPSLHRRAIELARAAGLHLTLHAGEGCCPEQIKEAVALGAERIGHGFYLYQDQETERRVAAAGIALEVCPTSNLQISGQMETYADHPLKRYLDRGIRVTVNTDNRLMSKTSSTREFSEVIEAFSLTPAEVKRLLLNSAAAAFAPEALRRMLSSQVNEAFSEIPASQGR